MLVFLVELLHFFTRQTFHLQVKHFIVINACNFLPSLSFCNRFERWWVTTEYSIGCHSMMYIIPVNSASVVLGLELLNSQMTKFTSAKVPLQSRFPKVPKQQEIQLNHPTRIVSYFRLLPPYFRFGVSAAIIDHCRLL